MPETVGQDVPSCKRRRLVWSLILVAGVGLGLAVKFGRHHWFPRRFAVVEEGQLYRSGYLEAGPLRDVIEERQLKTVLTLMGDEPGTPEQVREEAITREEGVELIRIGMPGDGRGDFALLDQAADVIADQSHRPLLVHCAAGVHRTGAALAAYRIKHCGWTLDEALAECDRQGYPIDDKEALCEHLRGYEAWRVGAASQPE